MKTINLTGLALLLALTLVIAPAAAAAAAPPTVVLDGDMVQFRQPPYTANGRLMIEARALLVKDGMSVVWDGDASTLSAFRPGSEITLKVGSRQAAAGGAQRTLETAAFMRDGSVFVALEDLVALLGKQVVVSAGGNQHYVTSSLVDRVGKLLNDPNLVYEGPTAGGYRAGEGKLLLGGRVVYEGRFSAGALQGYGKLYLDGKLTVEGGFRNNLPHGVADYYWPTGEVYKGEFADGRMTGEGSLYRGSHLLYSGNWLNGSRNGFGKIYNSAGLAYDGELLNDVRHGFGTLYNGANKQFQGDWVDGRMEGEGLLFNNAGVLSYTGSFMDNKKHGTGADVTVGMMEWIEDSDTNVITSEQHETVRMQYGTFVNGKRISNTEEMLYIGEKDSSKVPNGTGMLRRSLGSMNSRSGVLTNSETVYVGVVRDGAMHGKGIEFLGGSPVFEGSFEANKRNGYGREFTSGELRMTIKEILAGDIAPGAYISGVLQYDGEWRDGKRHGAGKLYEYAGDVSEYTGTGSVVITEGQFAAGQLRRNASYSVYKYTGALINGQMTGIGRLYKLEPSATGGYFAQSGSIHYDGPFVDGKKHGEFGLMYYDNGRRMYEGSFVHDKRHGEGTLYSSASNAREYVGEFRDDMKHGEGTLYNNGVRVYEGSFVNDMKDGYGVLYEGGIKVYEGSFKQNMKHGYGRYYQNNRLVYEGEYINDVRAN